MPAIRAQRHKAEVHELIGKENLIAIAKPWLGEEEALAARRAILSGWVTQGPEVAAFENDFAKSVGAKHACAVSSGTTALHLALLAVGARPGDEVITVSHSFIATANCINYCGAVPVFVDIEPGTFNINPAEVERVIGARTRAILCVHQMGMPCNLSELLEIGRKHNLPVIEDAACAIGSEILNGDSWERIGKPHGDIACFSFHPRKIVTTGDGGIITTSSGAWDSQFRLLRHQGIKAEDTEQQEKGIIFECYPVVGYNYRMTDIQAAIGREQLKRLDVIITRRRQLADRYKELLAEVPGLKLPKEPPWARSNWQSYCVELPHGCDQRQVMQAMLDAGVSTRRGIMCAHREPAYRHGSWSCGVESRICGCASGTCARLRESERAQDRAIALPLFHEMTDAMQVKVADTLISAVLAQEVGAAKCSREVARA
jgi:dTDP-4-amino-4,6-dideoxygalactose transaminase